MVSVWTGPVTRGPLCEVVWVAFAWKKTINLHLYLYVLCMAYYKARLSTYRPETSFLPHLDPIFKRCHKNFCQTWTIVFSKMKPVYLRWSKHPFKWCKRTSKWPSQLSGQIWSWKRPWKIQSLPKVQVCWCVQAVDSNSLFLSCQSQTSLKKLIKD